MAETASTLSAPEILLLEDSPGEAELFCQAMVMASQAHLPRVGWPRIDVRHTATDALHVLRHQAGLERSNLPELIVLDLDLPGGSSLAFLRELQRDARLKSLPVIMMAWSEEEALVRSLYALGVAAYVIKPLFFADLLTLVGQLCNKILSARGQALCEQGRGAYT